MGKPIDAVLLSFGFTKEAIDVLFEWFDVRSQKGFSRHDTKLKIRKRGGPPLWHFVLSDDNLEIERDVDCEPGEYWVPPRHIGLSAIKRFCIERLVRISFCKKDRRILFQGGGRKAKYYVCGGEVSVRTCNTIGLGEDGKLYISEEAMVEAQ